jgi:CheY-like chemotaxis protein
MIDQKTSDLRLNRINVLVVDDDRHMCGLLKTMLHSIGIRQVKLAIDAAEAFHELRFFMADVIITDLNMSPLDGIEFTRMIRHSPDVANRDTRIIMLTGHPEMRWVFEARRAGVNDFLAKPISIERLHTRLRRVLAGNLFDVRAGAEAPDEPGASDPGSLTQAEIEALLSS